MIRAISPACTAAVDCFGDPPDAELYPEEAHAVESAVDKRRKEFTTVRYCARLAMAELGAQVAPIPIGPDRAPQWPAGVVGSLTHCDGYRAAIVGWADVVLALGVDAEPHVALPAGVLELIARPDERSRLARLAAVSKGVRWDRLLFCVKESLYKAWFPMMKQWLDFQEAAVTFSIDDGPPSRQGGRFAAWLERPYTTSRGDRSVHMSGRWLARGGYLLAMTCIPGDVYANHET
jgi:4'-phosphopantetheinyl transferase EntD